MANVRTITLTNDTWQYVVFVRIGGTEAAAAKWFEKKFQRPPDSELSNNSDGVCIYADGEKSHVVWFAEWPSGSLAAHESFHSTVHVLAECGIEKLTEDNEEAFAYLIMWLVEQLELRKPDEAKPKHKDTDISERS